MSEEKLEFLDEKPEAEEVEEVTPEAEAKAKPEAEEPEAKTADDTGEDGSTPEPEFKTSKEHQAPLTALLDEREKRQKAEREAEELRQWRRQQEEQQRKAQEKRPDIYEDPDGFIRHTEQAFQQQLLNSKLENSRFFATREYGEELVNEAMAYFDQNPQQSWQFLQQPSPFHAAVEFYRKQKALQEIGDDPEKWRKSQEELLREQIRQELMAEAGQPQQPAQKKPPVSLASQPAAGRGEPNAKGSGFDAAFPS